MTNSKIWLYGWPKYPTTALIMKLGAQVNEFQHGVGLTVRYKYTYYYSHFCFILIVSSSVYACVFLFQRAVQRTLDAA